MTIGFVAEPYEEKNASGMGYVVVELMRTMAPALRPGETLTIFSSKPVDRALVPGPFANVLIPKPLIAKYLFFLRLEQRVDALIFMAPLLPLIVPRRVTAVVMCQELGSQKIKPEGLYETLYAFVRDRIFMPISLRRATHVIAASQATKDDIMRYYGIPEQKVTVIFDGYQDLRPYAAVAPAIDERMKPYFFFTGKVKYRKNVHGIVSAFIKFKKRTASSIKLVIGGSYGGPYYEKMDAALREAGLRGDVFFLGYTSIETLYSLYKQAVALVFPSLNEGFGMPVAEAMSLGTPVITAGISSTVEVAGDAAILVDPYDIDDISRAMERVAADAALRATLIAKGYEQAKKFSWPDSGKKYVDLIRALN